MSVEAGRSHICAIDQEGIVWVMGKNKKGELGLGDFVARQTPYPLLTLKGK
jgi:alpha-tubulin suppressor-like RCC1 family protein